MTSSHTAAVVACRVLGLYVGIFWLGILPVEVSAVFRGPWEPSLVWSLLSGAVMFAIPVALAIALWRLAPWIAKHMLAELETVQASPSAITLAELQVAAISILGLLFVFGTLPRVVALIFEQFWVAGADADTRSSIIAGLRQATVRDIVQIGLGAWLFFGARSFVKLLRRFQSANGS